MGKPIVKLFLAKPTEAYYQLSEEERANKMATVQESLEKAGGKTIITGDTSWSSEQWMFFGVEEYPDIEAAQQHAATLVKLDWFRYLESMTLLGTKWEEPS